MDGSLPAEKAGGGQSGVDGSAGHPRILLLVIVSPFSIAALILVYIGSVDTKSRLLFLGNSESCQWIGYPALAGRSLLDYILARF